jgi:hypothetical protein
MLQTVQLALRRSELSNGPGVKSLSNSSSNAAERESKLLMSVPSGYRLLQIECT